MEITLYGAAGEVTGSCYLVETDSARVVVDCGLFQGSDKVERLNKIPHSLIAKPIDAVILTHAHLDHSGRLPLFVKVGYRGPIYATKGSIDIARLILNDAANIQVQDAQRANRIRHRAGLPPIEPLFTPKDVAAVCQQMRELNYNQWHAVGQNIRVQAVEAGHILGSSSVKLTVNENGDTQTLIFSGDLGPFGAPILRDPARIDEADTVFIESTYGDRNHRPLTETITEFEQLIHRAICTKGKILVPTFAVGRAQQILYHLFQIFKTGSISPFPIYLDSPMAIAATELYFTHQDLMDEEAIALQNSGQLMRDFATVITCQTADESRALNNIEGPCLILAGAGMCNAGRILHHLKHNLWISSTVVIIVGYQARGSLGRLLLDGRSKVKIFGETIAVRATIRGLGGFSAHAGQSDLLRWLEPMARQRPRVIVTHGEDHPRHELAHKIHELYHIDAEIPRMGDILTI
ncbi:MAG: MBL fold metallo-hydrolase [Candidatus Melainabacteria bacterium]|nr:MBL fold metallo-hydrolase [Candidatus Melainabacteria bacterium]